MDRAWERRQRTTRVRPETRYARTETRGHPSTLAWEGRLRSILRPRALRRMSTQPDQRQRTNAHSPHPPPATAPVRRPAPAPPHRSPTPRLPSRVNACPALRARGCARRRARTSGPRGQGLPGTIRGRGRDARPVRRNPSLASRSRARPPRSGPPRRPPRPAPSGKLGFPRATRAPARRRVPPGCPTRPRSPLPAVARSARQSRPLHCAVLGGRRSPRRQRSARGSAMRCHVR